MRGRDDHPRSLTLVPAALLVAVTMLLLALVPTRGDPVTVLAKILVIFTVAFVGLATADRLSRATMRRARAADVRPVVVTVSFATAASTGLLAALVLPRAIGLAPEVARWLVVAAAAGVAGQAGHTAATRAWRLQRASERWTARPVESALVRLAVFLVPVAASLGCAFLLNRALPAAPDGVSLIARIAVVMAASYMTLYVVERAMRRLGPLAMLLKLSMAFPGPAPSRFAVARRSSNPRALQAQLEGARQDSDAERAQAAGTILSLATALTAHDARTRGHSERVRVFTDMLAEELHIPGDDRDKLRWTALLHDIGKLTVSPKILNKRGPLDRRQWDVIHRHPIEGARIIGPLEGWLGPWAAAVEQHHEHYDGTGYPHGVAASQIVEGARIISVADAYDTMTAPRPYRAAMTPRAAREEIVRCAGAQFDPVVARALLNLSIRRLWWRMGLVSWLGQIPLLGRVPQVVPPVTEVAAGVRTAAAVASVATLAALPGLEPGVQPARAGQTAAVAQPATRTASVVEPENEEPQKEPAPDSRETPKEEEGTPRPGGSDDADNPQGPAEEPAPSVQGGPPTDSEDDGGTQPGPANTGPEEEPAPPQEDEDAPPIEVHIPPGNAFGHINGNGHTEHGNGLGTGHGEHGHG